MNIFSSIFNRKETDLNRFSILLPPLANEADVDRDCGEPEDAPMLVAPIPAILCLCTGPVCG